MEELVGKAWHRVITRAADTGFAEAAVELEAVRGSIGLLFRAFGGDGGLRVEVASATETGARRRFLQRVAGTGAAVPLAWRDGETLRLPPVIDLFPERELNRDLYVWLAALAAADADPQLPLPWLERHRALTLQVLARFPGLGHRYRRLVDTYLPLRPRPGQLPEDEAAQERAIRDALLDPAAGGSLPWATRPPFPVHLWLHPSPPFLRGGERAPEIDGEEDDAREGDSKELERKSRRGERVEMPDGRDGLVALRMENILSWAEYVKVDRTSEDDEDGDAERAVDDMEVLSVSRDNSTSAHRLRFDLDLPSAEYDDIPLGGGITLPEWDFRRQAMLPDQCRIQPMLARHAEDQALPSHLKQTARRIRNQFEALVQTRVWHRGRPDGSEVDLDAYLRFACERQAGAVIGADGLYRELYTGNRDLACLLLADLSLSTDAAVNEEARVIDVVRDTLHLFTEALSATGDRFAMYGFSSKKRENVRVHTLKEFKERPDGRIRGRINAIKPGYYTRMGAAVRYATDLLSREAAARQLLLIVTDGKPNDLDRYEGRYGVEDTRMAVREARKKGLFPFCVTIDKEGAQYLPHLFGPDGFVVIRQPEELPRQLPLLYARLTA